MIVKADSHFITSAKPKKKESVSFSDKHLHLYKEVFEKETRVRELEKEFHDLIGSFTFKVWQFYCEVRRVLFNTITRGMTFYHDDAFDYVADNFTEEVDRLKKKRRLLIEEEDLLLSILQDIYDSKTYKVVSELRMKRDSIKNYISEEKFNGTLFKLIPSPIRSRINKALKNYSRKIRQIDINPDLSRTFRERFDTINTAYADIFVFSITAFDFRFQRPQHLSEQLAKHGNRVFYIENSFIQRHKQNDEKNTPLKVTEALPGVYKVQLPSLRPLNIYNDHLGQKDILFMKGAFKILLQEVNAVNPILKIDHPFWGPLTNELKMDQIYDCMDEHAGFSKIANTVEKDERLLLQQSDHVLVTSKYLYEKTVKVIPISRIHLIQNACDFEHFSLSSVELAKELSNIQKPIIGYYGAIAEWMDVEIIESICKEFPRASIVLIGRVTNNRIVSLSKKYKNLLLLNEKSYESLPSYLKAFDVCIIPFLLNKLIKATHPVKFFEYLAAGKPIVSTKLPEIIEYDNIAYFSSKNEFCRKIRLALKENAHDMYKKRIEIARNNQWNERGLRLENLIRKTLFPKVSIIILSYNHPQLTEKCIKSVYERSFYPNMEVIVVDNGSDEKTIEQLEDLQKRYAFVLIRNGRNLGFSKGNNIGTRRATGEFLVLLNNDTIVVPGWLQRLVYHAKGKKVGLVGPVTNNIGNEMKISIQYDDKDIYDLENAASSYVYGHWSETIARDRIAAFCWLMPKKVYNAIGGLDEQFGQALFEDDDYCMRVKQAGYEILGAEDVFVHHFGSQSLRKMKMNDYRALFNANRLKFERKWKIRWKPHSSRKKENTKE